MINANGNEVISSTYLDTAQKEIEIRFRDILKLLNFDTNDPQIKDTPKRWAKMMVCELLKGCYEPEPILTIFKNIENYDEMVFLGPIEVQSLCSHHFLTFSGSCYVAYLPNERIVGISKLSRVVKWFMRRPQIQEELTKQIAKYLDEKLQPKGIAVFIQASHLCMITRGVKEQSEAKMKTSCLLGEFKQKNVKDEFFNMIKLK